MQKFFQCLSHDLADSFTGERKVLTDFFKRMIAAFTDAEAHPQDFLLSGAQRGESPSDMFGQTLFCRLSDSRRGVDIGGKR
jgi:hypothetical protein